MGLILALASAALADPGCGPETELWRLHESAFEAFVLAVPGQARAAVERLEASPACAGAMAPGQLAQVYLWAAASLHAEAQTADTVTADRLRGDARGMLETAARLDEQAELPELAADVVGLSAAWEAARGRVDEAGVASLVAASPLVLDGRPLDRGEERTVAPGWHLVRALDAAGTTHRLDLERDDRVTVHVRRPGRGARVGALVAGGLLVAGGAAMFAVRPLLDNNICPIGIDSGDCTTVTRAQTQSDALLWAGTSAIAVGSGLMLFSATWAPSGAHLVVVHKF